MELKSKKSFLINTAYYVVLTLLFILFFRFSFSYLLPLIFGFLIAYFVQKPSRKIAEISHLPQSFCTIFLVISTFVLVVFCIWIFIYFSLGFLKSFSHNFLQITEKFEVFIDEITENSTEVFYRISPELTEYLSRFSNDFFSEISNKFVKVFTEFMTKTVSKIPLLFLSTIVSLVAGCYIAKDYNNWIKFLKGLCSENTLLKCRKFKNIFLQNTLALLKGYLKLYLITFLLLFVGFFVLGVKQVIFLSFLISLIDLLPILGTGTVLIPWSFFSLLDKNYFLGIGLAVLYLVVVLVRNFLEPKVVSKTFGINPLFTLILMFIGLRIFGVLGIILLPIIMITIIKYYKEI